MRAAPPQRWPPSPRPSRPPRLLVLTGTDLYRDIHQDAAARASLAMATALVVLQPPAWTNCRPRCAPRPA
jgi:hypothetical protein